MGNPRPTLLVSMQYFGFTIKMIEEKGGYLEAAHLSVVHEEVLRNNPRLREQLLRAQPAQDMLLQATDLGNGNT